MNEEKRLDITFSITVIFILLLIISILIGILSFKNIFHTTPIINIIQLMLAFLGAYIGAKLSGDRALEISREEQKLKEISIFQSNLKIEL